jgi:hypothetical protein
MFVLHVKVYGLEFKRQFCSYKAAMQFVRRNGYVHFIITDSSYSKTYVVLDNKVWDLTTSVMKVKELQKLVSDFHKISIKDSSFFNR